MSFFKAFLFSLLRLWEISNRGWLIYFGIHFFKFWKYFHSSCILSCGLFKVIASYILKNRLTCIHYHQQRNLMKRKKTINNLRNPTRPSFYRITNPSVCDFRWILGSLCIFIEAYSRLFSLNRVIFTAFNLCRCCVVVLWIVKWFLWRWFEFE